MKSILLSILILISGQTVSATGLGQQVQIYSDATGPQFGAMFANDTDKLWTVTISFWAGDLLPNHSMKTLSWRLYESKLGTYIGQWAPAVENASPVTYPGTMAFTWELQKQDEILKAVKNVKSLHLVLAVDQDLSSPIATHFVDLGGYCNSHPGHFINLSTGRSGCGAE